MKPSSSGFSRSKVFLPILMGDANLGERFGGVYGLPQSFLIDARGLIVFRGVGEPNIEALRSQIEGLIGIH